MLRLRRNSFPFPFDRFVSFSASLKQTVVGLSLRAENVPFDNQLPWQKVKHLEIELFVSLKGYPAQTVMGLNA